MTYTADLRWTRKKIGRMNLTSIGRKDKMFNDNEHLLSAK